MVKRSYVPGNGEISDFLDNRQFNGNAFVSLPAADAPCRSKPGLAERFLRSKGNAAEANHRQPVRIGTHQATSHRRAFCRSRAHRRTALLPPASLATATESEALANALCHRDYAMGGGSIGLAVYDDRLEDSVSVR